MKENYCKETHRITSELEMNKKFIKEINESETIISAQTLSRFLSQQNRTLHRNLRKSQTNFFGINLRVEALN